MPPLAFFRTCFFYTFIVFFIFRWRVVIAFDVFIWSYIYDKIDCKSTCYMMFFKQKYCTPRAPQNILTFVILCLTAIFINKKLGHLRIIYTCFIYCFSCFNALFLRFFLRLTYCLYLFPLGICWHRFIIFQSGVSRCLAWVAKIRYI